MELATTVALVALRGPVPLAKTLAALDLLSDGRVVAGVGPGSSERDYDAVGVPYEERWERFDEAVAILRSLLRDDPPPETRRHYALPGSQLAPAPRRPGGIPLWIGSWGSKAGLRRVARLGDGWLASAYNTTPDGFKAAKQSLSEQLDAHGRDPDRFPNALATMWTWVTEDARDADRVLREVLAPMLQARSRCPARPAVHRTGGALRGAALTLRAGRLRARVPLAARRRASADRARGDGRASRRQGVSPGQHPAL